MLPPECEAALEQLDAFRRGELGADDLLLMQRHLDECGRCLAFNKHEEAFLDRLVSVARSARCPEELRANISVMLAKESSGN